MDHFGAVPVAAAEYEAPILFRFGFELVERFDQADVVFCRMLQARNIQEERRINAVTLHHYLFRGFLWYGEKALMIESVVNDRDTLLRNRKKSLYVLRGV